MSQGRGSAGQARVMVVVLLCFLAHLARVHAATYTVGDSGGWNFNTDSWPKGKRFRAGDVLGKSISYLSPPPTISFCNIMGEKICCQSFVSVLLSDLFLVTKPCIILMQSSTMIQQVTTW